jgi:hypothetical protein
MGKEEQEAISKSKDSANVKNDAEAVGSDSGHVVKSQIEKIETDTVGEQEPHPISKIHSNYTKKQAARKTKTKGKFP